MNERGSGLLEAIWAGFLLTMLLGIATFKIAELQKYFVMAQTRLELSHVLLQAQRLSSWSGSDNEIKKFLVGGLRKNIDVKAQCSGNEHGSCTVNVKIIGNYGVTKESEVIQY